MTQVTLPVTSRGSADANNFSDVYSNDNAIARVVNGGLDNGNLSGTAGITGANIASGTVTADNLADGAKLGINGASTVRRGKSIIATEQSVTNTSYRLMTTPDRVQNVVLPTDGLIYIAYEALMKGSGSPANGTSIADAAIFIGSNQLKVQTTGGTPAVQLASILDDDGTHGGNDATNVYQYLHTLAQPSSASLLAPYGLVVSSVATASAFGSFVATGMPTTPLAVFAAAGTYDISIQFKAPTGTVTAKERKLWVWTVGF